MLKEKISLDIKLPRFKTIDIYNISEKQLSHKRVDSILIASVNQSSEHETYILSSLERQSQNYTLQKICSQLHVLKGQQENRIGIVKSQTPQQNKLLSLHFDKIIFAKQSLQFVQPYNGNSYLALDKIQRDEYQMFLNFLNQQKDFEFKSKMKIGLNNQISNLCLLNSKSSLFVHYHSQQNPQLNEIKLFDLPLGIIIDIKPQFFSKNFRHHQLHMFPKTISIFSDIFVNGIYDIRQNSTTLGLYDLRSLSGHMCLLADSRLDQSFNGGFQFLSKIQNCPFQILTTKRQAHQKFKPIILDVRKPMKFIQASSQLLPWKHLRYLKMQNSLLWIVCKKFDNFSYKGSQIKCYQFSK